MLATWEELLAEFRALGGAADNVRLAEGALGRGLFVVDPSRPFLLRTPPNLLVNVNDVVFENGALRLASNAKLGGGERKFFEAYHDHISWDGGGRAEIERIFEQAQVLPGELRHRLGAEYHCGEWFEDACPTLIQNQFIETREFGDYQGRRVMMPMIELANHGSGCSYDSTDGISLKGQVNDEITVRYTETDTYGIFRSWGFVSEGNVAFSTELAGSIGGTKLYIERQPQGATPVGNRPVLPTLTRMDDSMKLNFLMLGNRKLPRLCRGDFRRIFRSAGFGDVDESFDKIRSANQQHFLALLADLEALDGPIVLGLRRMARLQLQAMTHCFGSREI